MTTMSNVLTLGSDVTPIRWEENAVWLLDQTALPHEERYVRIETADAMAKAIQTMVVRGAPAIGIAGAYGLVLAAQQATQQPHITVEEFSHNLRQEAEKLNRTRPTAVNLQWALDHMLEALEVNRPLVTGPEDLVNLLRCKAIKLHHEDIQACQAIGCYGAMLVPKGARILTHCNAGALATGGYGTALGIVRSAFAQDSTLQVFADETRPRLQGARLTTWELTKDGIPVTLIADGMAASLMAQGRIDLVLVGADRIAANGDTANKIGTYALALAAYTHNIPFYVAAPLSSIDMAIISGKAIPIEERDTDELEKINRETLCAKGTAFYNPAFDVTPFPYITAIITEKGVVRPDFLRNLPVFFGAYQADG